MNVRTKEYPGGVKHCVKCKEIKPVEQFSQRSEVYVTKSGEKTLYVYKESVCKECQSKRGWKGRGKVDHNKHYIKDNFNGIY